MAIGRPLSTLVKTMVFSLVLASQRDLVWSRKVAASSHRKQRVLLLQAHQLVDRDQGFKTYIVATSRDFRKAELLVALNAENCVEQLSRKKYNYRSTCPVARRLGVYDTSNLVAWRSVANCRSISRHMFANRQLLDLPELLQCSQVVQNRIRHDR